MSHRTTDIYCLCTNSQFQADAGLCLIRHCTPTDRAAAQALSVGQCSAGYGANGLVTNNIVQWPNWWPKFFEIQAPTWLNLVVSGRAPRRHFTSFGCNKSVKKNEPEMIVNIIVILILRTHGPSQEMAPSFCSTCTSLKDSKR